MMLKGSAAFASQIFSTILPAIPRVRFAPVPCADWPPSKKAVGRSNTCQHDMIISDCPDALVPSFGRSKKHGCAYTPNRFTGLIAMFVFLLGGAAVGGEGCRKYASYHRLPGSFQEIASGELSGLPHRELFVLSDGICTCANVFNDSRSNGGTHLNRAIWSCRPATDDERPSKSGSNDNLRH
jgi:hypothetical protein